MQKLNNFAALASIATPVTPATPAKVCNLPATASWGIMRPAGVPVIGLAWVSALYRLSPHVQWRFQLSTVMGYVGPCKGCGMPGGVSYATCSPIVNQVTKYQARGIMDDGLCWACSGY